MPIQKTESIDEPRRAAAATGQLELFQRRNPKQDDLYVGTDFSMSVATQNPRRIHDEC